MKYLIGLTADDLDTLLRVLDDEIFYLYQDGDNSYTDDGGPADDETEYRFDRAENLQSLACYIKAQAGLVSRRPSRGSAA